MENAGDNLTVEDLIPHLHTEIGRLVADRDKALAQVRAEQAHNQMLVRACGWYRSAARTALGYMREVAAMADEGNPVSAAGCKNAVTDTVDDILAGDKIRLPVAKED